MAQGPSSQAGSETLSSESGSTDSPPDPRAGSTDGYRRAKPIPRRKPAMVGRPSPAPLPSPQPIDPSLLPSAPLPTSVPPPSPDPTKPSPPRGRDDDRGVEYKLKEPADPLNASGSLQSGEVRQFELQLFSDTIYEVFYPCRGGCTLTVIITQPDGTQLRPASSRETFRFRTGRFEPSVYRLSVWMMECVSNRCEFTATVSLVGRSANPTWYTSWER